MKINRPNILLVSGDGQNTGKTSLVCKLIEHFSKVTNLVAVKITHHHKTLSYEMPIVSEQKEYCIYQEVDKEQTKDSSRMLMAGATLSYFIISQKEALGNAMEELLSLIDPNSAIICESGGLADFYQTGLHLHLKGEIPSDKPTRNADIELTFDGENFSFDITELAFIENRWKITQT